MPLVQRVVTIVLALLVVYLLVGGVFIFMIHRPGGGSLQEVDVSRFLGSGVGVDKALVVEDRMDSAIARINLIEGAQGSIDLAYYAVHDGLSSDLFYAALLEAADRGVLVRLLFDGIFHNLKGHGEATLRALLSHPNISVRFYEPLNLLLPWTLNNRLHDKVLLIDNTYALIGGRNIGDKYFLDSYAGSVVEDRDVLIINTAKGWDSSSVLVAFSEYYERLWESPYTKERRERPFGRDEEVEKQRVLDRLGAVRSEYPTHFFDPIDWEAWALPTKKVSLITNPITRLNKEPRVLMDVMAAKGWAASTVHMQSPYIIPSALMREYWTEAGEGVTLRYLTNSGASSPNVFANGGYRKHRDAVAAESGQLFEYHGNGSIHAKTYIFDSRLSMVGSFNLDARSSFLSTESMVVIDSVPLAEALQEKMEALASKSVANSASKYSGPWYKRVAVMVSRILLYPFDALL